MRWIKHRKKDDMYRVWSTVVDNWLTDWETKEYIIRWFARDMRRKVNREIKEMKKTFPAGFGNKDKPYSIFPYNKSK